MPAGTQKSKKSQKKTFNSNSDKVLLEFLYIEDYDEQREAVVNDLCRKGYENILAPSSISECVSVLKNGGFSHAILDYKLSKWVGKNDNIPIKPNGKKYYNGVEIAQFLKDHYQQIQIVLFSTHPGSLDRAYQNLPDKKDISILKREETNLADDIIKYIEDSHQFELVVKPIHKITTELPNAIKAFYAKKILNSFKPGEYIWKAGKYAWLAGINKEISFPADKIEQSGEYTSDNPEETFLLNIDKDGIDIESVVDKSANLEINFNDVLKDNSVYKSDSLIHKYFITYAICKKYLNGEIDAAEVNRLIVMLGDKTIVEYAMFESQKILFKELSQNDSIQAAWKEEIYDLLSEFRLNGFQQILDIYKCRVDSIEDDIAYVKFESFSPENVVRVEKFSAEFLSEHHILNEDAQFEYTIYITSLGGGSSYHIEPI